MKSIEDSNLNKKLAAATKWSTFTEIIAKLITPISSMVLARVLAPEVFGIVTSVNMVISFCDLFTDAGFQKYLIQHEVENRDKVDSFANVAFWTNLAISVLIWGVIIVFATPVAKSVGCPGKDLAIIIACANLPLTSFSSVQTALLKREMNFKPLFYARIVTIVIPIVVTVPLALVTRSYWSMIAGTIVSNFATVIVLTFLVEWKPRFHYSFQLLKRMLDFSIWSLLESVLVWVINWGDVFIVRSILTSYYLGLYKTSMNMVNQVISVISASMVPVLLSVLSRLQGNDEEFRRMYYRFSRLTGMLLLPMGIGMFIFQDTMCFVALGSSWSEASTLMGTWGLVSAISILLNSYNGNVLIAKGKPKISVIIQIIQIVFIIPTVYFSAMQGFECLSYARAFVRIVGMVAYTIAVKRIADVSFVRVVQELWPSLVSTLVMGLFGLWIIKLNRGILFELAGIAGCMAVYAGVMLLFPSVRKTVRQYIVKAN